MQDRLTHGAFLEEVNSKFRLRPEGADTIELELVRVSELKRTDLAESFSLEFRGPAAFILPQRTYQMEHDRMGRIELFMVPVAQDKEGVYYEVVFNRLQNRER